MHRVADPGSEKDINEFGGLNSGLGALERLQTTLLQSLVLRTRELGLQA